MKNQDKQKIKNLAFDAMYQGKLNPRCTFHCHTCGKYYSNMMEREPKEGEPTFTLIINDETGSEDCVHYNDIEVTEKIYTTHIKELKEQGFLKDDELSEDF